MQRSQESTKILGCEWDLDVAVLPEIEFPYIYMLLFPTIVKNTKQSLRANKSSHSWPYFETEFVSKLNVVRNSVQLRGIQDGEFDRSKRRQYSLT